MKRPRTAVYLVRHGEAVGNASGLYLGQTDPPLTAAGRRQAAEVASRLAGLPLAGVLTSDLRRAAATADAIAARHALAARRDERLREADFGAWSGRGWRAVAAGWPRLWDAWVSDPERTAPPGGETLVAVRRRAVAVLAGIPEGQTWALVTHGGIIRALLPGVLPVPAGVYGWPPGSDPPGSNSPG